MSNPKWTRDELILALHLYLLHRHSFPPKNHPDIQTLSNQLNILNNNISDKNQSFRNPNGVYMKLNNFKSIDPEYTETGKVGLWRTSKLDNEVWNDFSNSPEELAVLASTILSNLHSGSNSSDLPFVEQITAREGQLLSKIHLIRERSRSLVNCKKKQVLQETGKLQCEACGFSFQEKYGEKGEGVIEVHHTKPLHALRPGTITTLDDLSLICANCHRVIHSNKPWLTLEELKSIISVEH